MDFPAPISAKPINHHHYHQFCVQDFYSEFHPNGTINEGHTVRNSLTFLCNVWLLWPALSQNPQSLISRSGVFWPPPVSNLIQNGRKIKKKRKQKKTLVLTSHYRLMWSSPIQSCSVYIYVQSGPKKCIHSLLINIFGINWNEISISGWECNIMFSQQMAQALL